MMLHGGNNWGNCLECPWSFIEVPFTKEKTTFSPLMRCHDFLRCTSIRPNGFKERSSAIFLLYSIRDCVITYNICKCFLNYRNWWYTPGHSWLSVPGRWNGWPRQKRRYRVMDWAWCEWRWRSGSASFPNSLPVELFPSWANEGFILFYWYKWKRSHLFLYSNNTTRYYLRVCCDGTAD